MSENPHILSPNAKRLIIFWTRMVVWIAFSCIIPISVFAAKFGLFKESSIQYDSLGNVVEASSVSLNGWGIVACAIVGFTASAIIKEVIAAYPGYSLTKQWLSGFRKTVLPLVIGFFVCLFIREVVAHLMFCFGTLAVCQFIAVPVNPLPKWRFEKSGVEDYTSTMSGLASFVKHKNLTKEDCDGSKF